ncbi:hypothetical protein J8M21_24240 [Pseudoalteromonas luteoviolacea]|uniref:hypothetical protein n=1 Tax=Pseudoalteromonas luteoviolacea TaxID=43657 RepID=UPI001B3A0A29|nr:hypothetical protein [Pseudoalteromonas luteoviolacea]MBQ4880315.1 hypothetical protein [Pseudoalteromonas luteoviolacea]MBQ4909401.1 hypothetical protein [Pseudoalteromonas luteoviolacea]
MVLSLKTKTLKILSKDSQLVAKQTKLICGGLNTDTVTQNNRHNTDTVTQVKGFNTDTVTQVAGFNTDTVTQF